MSHQPSLKIVYGLSFEKKLKEDSIMKLAPGIFGLFFAGFVYMQAFNVSTNILKQMEVLMQGAAAQLSVTGQTVRPVVTF